ncbi:MAG: hypothetical protein ACE5J3_14785 [Methanosarcinales archaeon]
MLHFITKLFRIQLIKFLAISINLEEDLIKNPVIPGGEVTLTLEVIVVDALGLDS